MHYMLLIALVGLVMLGDPHILEVSDITSFDTKFLYKGNTAMTCQSVCSWREIPNVFMRGTQP